MVFRDPPVICGHRGSGKGVVEGHRENTLESFQAAAAAGLPWVEVDARLNADGLLVSRHDPRAEDGRLVADLSTAETDELGLMRLDDLLEQLPPEIGVDLEVKTSIEDAARPRGETTAARAADLVKRLGGERQLFVSSFDPSAVLIVHELLPDVALGMVARRCCPVGEAIAAAAHLGVGVLGVNAGAFGVGEAEAAGTERSPAGLVAAAHDAGLEVLVWSATPAEEDELVAAGVECIVVDDVAEAIARHRRRTEAASR